MKHIGSNNKRDGYNPTLAYAGNIEISLAPGMKDEEGIIIEENARLGVRAVVKALEILNKYAGLL